MLAIVMDDSDDVPVPIVSTFSCKDDIKAVELHTKEHEHIPLEKLEWDYDMKHGRIRKLTRELWRDIVGSFGMTPLVQVGHVVVP